MDETLCKCERFVIEIESGVWVHEDDDDTCTPDESLTEIMFERAS